MTTNNVNSVTNVTNTINATNQKVKTRLDVAEEMEQLSDGTMSREDIASLLCPDAYDLIDFGNCPKIANAEFTCEDCWNIEAVEASAVSETIND